jgi:hypothetical protein
MKKTFAIAGYGEEVREEFGGMLHALSHASAARRHRARHRPHRDAAVRGGACEVVLFPMNQRADDLLMVHRRKSCRSNFASRISGSICQKNLISELLRRHYGVVLASTVKSEADDAGSTFAVSNAF